jgi:[acyl-carrier-protein] S-malonyltransferase
MVGRVIAFVFPGQGSQSVGMLSSFAENAEVDQALERASAVLGQDLRKLISAGPIEDLDLTVNTQPAMLVAGVAIYRAWRAAGGPEPAWVAGHSLGEYSALTAADALTLEDAVRVVRFRASAMQEAVPVGVGAMAAVLGLSDDDVRRACAEAAGEEVVEAVNFNAPAQVVIAGNTSAVERACAAAKRLGAKRAVSLPVSAPFHSSLMRPAGERLRQLLQSTRISVPRIPLINNVDVASETEPARIVDALARQAYSPVRWVEIVRALAAHGVTHIVECGPGKALSGMTKRIAPEVECVSISDLPSLSDAIESFRQPGAGSA